VSTLDQYVVRAEALLDEGRHSKESITRMVFASVPKDEPVDPVALHEALDALYRERREAAA
jgi:hypothetical protein